MNITKLFTSTFGALLFILSASLFTSAHAGSDVTGHSILWVSVYRSGMSTPEVEYGESFDGKWRSTGNPQQTFYVVSKSSKWLKLQEVGGSFQITFNVYDRKVYSRSSSDKGWYKSSNLYALGYNEMDTCL